MLTRYDADCTAAVEVSRYGAELVSAVEAAGIPLEEATRIAEQIEDLAPPPAPLYPSRRFMLARLLFAFLWRSLLGVYVIERFIRRRQNR